MKFNLPEILYEVPSKAALEAEFGEQYWIARNIARRIALRTRLSEAQNHRCCYCGIRTSETPGGKAQATIEHVLARRRGGQDVFEHCVMACIACNNKRGDALLDAEEDLFGLVVTRHRHRQRRNRVDRRFIFKSAEESARIFAAAMRNHKRKERRKARRATERAPAQDMA